MIGDDKVTRKTAEAAALKARKETDDKFADTVKRFSQSTIMAELANRQVESGGKELQTAAGALSEVKQVFKQDVITPFRNMATSFMDVIPGLNVANKIRAIIWANTFGQNKRQKDLQKTQKELLAKSLGLTTTQLSAQRAAAEALKTEQSILDEVGRNAEEFGLATTEQVANAKKFANTLAEILTLEKKQYDMSGSDEDVAQWEESDDAKRLIEVQKERAALSETELKIAEQSLKINEQEAVMKADMKKSQAMKKGGVDALAAEMKALGESVTSKSLEEAAKAYGTEGKFKNLVKGMGVGKKSEYLWDTADKEIAKNREEAIKVQVHAAVAKQSEDIQPGDDPSTYHEGTDTFASGRGVKPGETDLSERIRTPKGDDIQIARGIIDEAQPVGQPGDSGTHQYTHGINVARQDLPKDLEQMEKEWEEVLDYVAADHWTGRKALSDVALAVRTGERERAESEADEEKYGKVNEQDFQRGHRKPVGHPERDMDLDHARAISDESAKKWNSLNTIDEDYAAGRAGKTEGERLAAFKSSLDLGGSGDTINNDPTTGLRTGAGDSEAIELWKKVMPGGSDDQAIGLVSSGDEPEEVTADSTANLLDLASSKGSLFVHDTHSGKILTTWQKSSKSSSKEDKNEERRRGDQLQDALEGIEDGLGKDGKGKKGPGMLAKLAGGAGGLFGMGDAMGSMIGTAMGPTVAKAVAGLGKFMLPAAIVLWGITSAGLVIRDFLAGAEDGGAAGGIAKALAGDAAGGAKNALGQGMKWAGIGATIGLAFPPVGWIIGALIGAAFGGILGWFGSDKIKKGIDGVTDFFGFPVLMTPDEVKAHQLKIDNITAKIANLKSDVIPQIDAEIQVYKDLQAKGKKLTLEEMQALDLLYTEKMEAEQAIIDGTKDLAKLERDKKRQELASLNEKRSKLKDDKAALTTKLTQVGDSGQMVHGEIYALELEIRQLHGKITKAEKAGLTTETASLKNKLALAEASLSLKQDVNAALDIELQKSADAIYAEQKLLHDQGLLSGWETMTFGFKTYGRNFKEGWNAIGRDLSSMATKLGNWIYTPGQDTGPGGMGAGKPAKLFGVELKWPDFSTMIGDFWSGKTFEGWLPSWMTTPISELITWPEITWPTFTLPELTWPELKMPDLSGVLNLPDWMTNKDFFKFEWPKITAKDLTDGVKNLVRGLLPDPVKDPWMYKLMPQKIYDWLGVSTAQRELEAEMAEASGEVQKLAQQRLETAAVKVQGEEGGYWADLPGRMDTADERAEAIADIDKEILEAEKRVVIAQEKMAKAGLSKGSLFTHDTVLEKLLKSPTFVLPKLKSTTGIEAVPVIPLLGHDFLLNQNRLGVIGQGLPREGPTTAMQQINAPQTSAVNNVSTIMQSPIGTKDPHTHLSHTIF